MAVKEKEKKIFQHHLYKLSKKPQILEKLAK